MTRTDKTSTPAKGVAHDHGNTQVDGVNSNQATRLAGHDKTIADHEARLAALENATPPAPTPEPPPTGDTSWFGKPSPFSAEFQAYPEAPAGMFNLPSGTQVNGKTFEHLRFTNRQHHVNVIAFEGLSNFRLLNLYFEKVPEVMYFFNCKDYEIGNIWVKDIFGAFTRDGFHSGNFVQAVRCSGGNHHDLLLEQPASVPSYYAPMMGANATVVYNGKTYSTYGTEDIFNIGGEPGSYGNLLFERARINGGAWNSWSGTGIMVGDGGGGHDITFRDMDFTDPGQCGYGSGEEGPYNLERVTFKSARPDVNACLQIRSNNTNIKNTLVDWTTGKSVVAYGGEPVPATRYNDLGGNNWSADL